MLLGITATTLLSGCGGSDEGATSKNQSKEVNAEKSSKEIAQEMYEAEKKSKEVEKELNALRESDNSEFLIDFNIKIDGKKPQKLTFDVNNGGNLSLDSFKSLKVGMSAEKVAKTLDTNVASASFMRIKQYGKLWEGTMYTYEYENGGIVTQIEAYFTHEDDELKLYGARRTEVNRANKSKQTTLDNKRGVIGQGADTEKDTPKNDREADTTSEGVTKSTDKPAPSKSDTSAKSAKSSIPNDYCGHGHDETKQEAHGCEKIIDEEAHQRHLRQQEREYEEQQRKEAEKYQDEMTEEDKARILRQEKRWNTPSGGIGDKWQDELKEMEEQEGTR